MADEGFQQSVFDAGYCEGSRDHVVFKQGYSAHALSQSKPQGETCHAEPKHPVSALVYPKFITGETEIVGQHYRARLSPYCSLCAARAEGRREALAEINEARNGPGDMEFRMFKIHRICEQAGGSK